jgi:capsular exopolysaccharide synthesis family protein
MGIIPASPIAMSDSEAYTVVQHKGFSLIAEALRNLHIGLEVKQGTRRPGEPLTITVTSAMANEGKSMVSSNLALLFAGLGRKVLLVDADMRKRSLSKAFQCDQKPGLRELLGNAPWSPSLAIAVGTPTFHLLPAGDVTRSSLDTIQPEAFARTLALLKPGFDVIIFDTPPVLPMADACIMGQASDVTLLIVRSRPGRDRRVQPRRCERQGSHVRRQRC